MAVELLAALDGDELAAMHPLAQGVFLYSKGGRQVSEFEQRLMALQRDGDQAVEPGRESFAEQEAEGVETALIKTGTQGMIASNRVWEM